MQETCVLSLGWEDPPQKEMAAYSSILAWRIPWTEDRCGLQSMEFSRPEYWSGQPFPSPGDLPNPGIEHRSPSLQADSLPAKEVGNSCILTWRHSILLNSQYVPDYQVAANNIKPSTFCENANIPGGEGHSPICGDRRTVTSTSTKHSFWCQEHGLVRRMGSRTSLLSPLSNHTFHLPTVP